MKLYFFKPNPGGVPSSTPELIEIDKDWSLKTLHQAVLDKFDIDGTVRIWSERDVNLVIPFWHMQVKKFSVLKEEMRFRVSLIGGRFRDEGDKRTSSEKVEESNMNNDDPKSKAPQVSAQNDQMPCEFRGSVWGKLSKSPLEGSRVTFKNVETQEIVTGEVLTDMKGRFSMLLNPGTYKMNVAKAKYETQVETIVVGTTPGSSMLIHLQSKIAMKTGQLRSSKEDSKVKNMLKKKVAKVMKATNSTDYNDEIIALILTLSTEEIFSLTSNEKKLRSMVQQARHLFHECKDEQKQMLGERLFPVIHRWHPDMAGKITKMLLEIENSELMHMLEHQESLKAKVDNFIAELKEEEYKEILFKAGGRWH